MPVSKAPRHVWRMFVHFGPIGLSHAVQDLYITWRLRRLAVFIDREKELHREMVRNLNHETNDLIGRQQALRVAASHFQRLCEKQDEERIKPVAGN
jgi:hypothetical protein